MKNNNLNILIVALLILMAAAARVMNAEMHLYNFAPMAALGLFSGAIIKDRRIAFLLAISGQLLADVYFQLFTNTPGFYGMSQLFTYAALMGATMLGVWMTKLNVKNIFLYTFGASTLFFLVSNFGVWVTGLYGTGFSAFVTTYTMAIPFFKNAIIGDLAGSTLLFGSYFLLQQAFAGKMQKAGL